MARQRRSLWGLLALPLLAGALLLMHGFGPLHDGGPTSGAPHAVDEPATPAGESACPTCEPHAMVMVCLAVLGGVVSTLLAARRRLGIPDVLHTGAGVARRLAVPRPSLGPAWLRLSVILR